MNKGYIAIASILIITVVVTLIATTTSLSSINEAQISFSNLKGDSSLDLVEGCVEDALIYLNENDSLPSSVNLPSGSCSITIESQAGGDWAFLVNAAFENYTKKVRIQANRSTTITINSWQEVE